MKAKLLSLVLISGILLTSCGSGADVPAKTEDASAAPETTTAAPVVTEPVYDKSKPFALIEKKDFAGYEFKIIVRNDAATSVWYSTDFIAEAINGEPLNDAVYARGKNVEDFYNCKISVLHPGGEVAAVQKAVLAGEAAYDMTAIQTSSQATLAKSCSLFDLKSASALDLSAEYWDQTANGSLTILNKQFFAMGDINITDNKATWVTVFNKKLAKDYKLPDSYAAVKSGGWTLDALYANAKAVSTDKNGDGQMGKEDIFGVYTQYSASFALLNATGRCIVTKDADDKPVYNFNSEGVVNAFDKIYTKLSDTKINLFGDGTIVNNKWADFYAMYMSDLALYFITPLSNSFSFRDMESEYGFLPLPKLDEKQTDYVNSLQENNATAVAIPLTSDLERSAAIMEALAAASPAEVTPAFYDIMLLRKIARDDESEAMLDLIFSTRVIDLGYVFNWQNAKAFTQNLIKAETNTFVSSEAAIRDAFKNEMETTLKEITK